MTDRKKVFVSIPMSGKDDTLTWALMSEYRRRLSLYMREDLDIIDQLHKSPDLTHSVAILGDSIMAMADADYILFAPDWNKARGCQVEYIIARNYMKEKIISDDIRKQIFDGYEDDITLGEISKFILNWE